jgi:hypothetical protein
MRRNWLLLALLLSVGVNCGLLGMGIARHRLLERWADDSRGDPGDRRGRHARPIDRFGPPGPGEPDAASDRPFRRAGVRLADRLGLEGEVRESFLGLQRALAERVHDGRERLDGARRELRRELVAEQPDSARVEELIAAIVREQEALDRALVANVLAARELLEPTAEGEYLRFVERIGAAVSSGTPPPMAGQRSRERP